MSDDEENDPSSSSAQEEAAKARAAAQAVLEMAEKRDSGAAGKSKNGSTTIVGGITLPTSPFGNAKPLKNINQKIISTTEQVQKELSTELNALQEDITHTTEQIGTAIGKARQSFTKRVSGIVDAAGSPLAMNKPKLPISLSSANAAGAAVKRSSDVGKKVSPDDKILADLELVNEQVTLCNSMVTERDDNDPALLKVLGFLEACLPRMDELLVAAMMSSDFAGAVVLQEDTIHVCLTTYERLLLTLEQCQSPLVADSKQQQQSTLRDAETPQTSEGKP